MKKPIIFLILISVVLSGGCGLISILSSPTRHEQKITAEYNLTKLKDEKILVLVSADDILSRMTNMRYNLTDALNKNLL